MRACALGMIAQPAAPPWGMLGQTHAACRTLKTLFVSVCARICRIWRTVVPRLRATNLLRVSVCVGLLSSDGQKCVYLFFLVFGALWRMSHAAWNKLQYK